MVNKVAMLFMLKISLGVDNVHIIKVGLNYEDTPIEVREKLTFSEETIEEAMLYLNTKKSMLENVIFSTCNRTEIYAVVRSEEHTSELQSRGHLVCRLLLEK